MQRLNSLASTAALTVVLALFGPAASGDEPPAKAAPGENDPLLQAVRRIQADVDKLRSEVRTARGQATPAATTTRAEVLGDFFPGVRPLPSPAEIKTSARQSMSRPQKTSDHWSLRPLRSPPLPTVNDESWPREDLDRFILARLEPASLKPNPDADRHTLLRRVALDLTGLPARETEIEDFVGDPAPLDEALARAVDGYLDSPRFGERWGRHWLDVVRYADSVGRTWNAPFTYAWRYRDYVIDAFNQDKPYDRFLLEQLAGDLLPAKSIEEQRENLIATGFLTLSAMSLNDGRLEGFLMDRVDEQLDVTSRAVMGLTIACARCHDHKYDPVTMRDYYALAGIFYSTRVLSGQGHSGELGPGGYVDAEQLVRLPSEPGASPSPPPVDAVHSMADYRAASQRDGTEARYTTDPDLAMGVMEGELRDCDLRVGGDAYDRGNAPPRGEHQVPGLPPLPAIPEGESGRLELAQWLVSPEHPLTARVMANRIWQHLFGKGLVRTVDDFGSSGEAPTHPDLLDHLAARFQRDGWSIKRLIRAIVLSRTYRQSSTGNSAAKAKDPANDLYWRMDPRRLEIEVLRDGLLHAAGRLEFQRPVGIQVAGTGGKGKTAAVRSLLPLDAPYRTVYLPVLRASVPELYDTFDFPDPCQLIGQRQVTTVAPQALFFLNSDLASGSAAAAAQRLLADQELADAGRIRHAYRRLFGRPASPEEIAAARDLLASLEPPEVERDPKLYRWTALIQALFASGEFRYVF